MVGVSDPADRLSRPAGRRRVAARLAKSALIAACAAVVVLGLLEVRVGWRLSYDNPDIPTEMMVYTQTSTDVKRMVLESNQLSRELEAQGDGKILFDTGADGLSWPLYWYFRDNPNASPFGGTLNANTNAAVIFILANRSGTPQNAAVLSKYTGVTYAFRWHFPEELYRNFAIAPELPPGRSARKVRPSAWPDRCDQVGCRELGVDIRGARPAGAVPHGRVSRHR